MNQGNREVLQGLLLLMRDSKLERDTVEALLEKRRISEIQSVPSA